MGIEAIRIRGVYPPNFFIFMAQTPPIFIGMPCTNTMFTSPWFCATSYKDKCPDYDHQHPEKEVPWYTDPYSTSHILW